MLVLIGIGFVAGLITAISPCVLPVLPILLAGGATSPSPRRPYTIVAGLVGSFTLFTLGGAWILSSVGLPQDFLRNLAIALLLVLAATLVIPQVGRVLERPFLPLTRRRAGNESNGLVLGASLGLVFVPCAGPVLAAMTAVSAAGDVGPRAVAVTLSYAVGAATPMLLFAKGGQRIGSSLGFVRRHADATRRVAGVVLGATAVAIAVGVDQRFTTALPGYTEALQNRVERNSAARRELRRLTQGDSAAAAIGEDGTSTAPEFEGIAEWLNTPDGGPLSMRSLRGKVVLIDFWTYSCINCLRTLPHLKAWDRTYRDDGLVIVGVHTPEFAFERVPSNVRSAVERLGLRYAVALDNGYETWNAFQNQYWPAKYLIDRSGHVRFTHFGEGEYDTTEMKIRELLGERFRSPLTRVKDATPKTVTTPESYLGYLRLASFANGAVAHDRYAQYTFPSRLREDEMAYAGRWRVEPERAVAGQGARLQLRFYARDVHLVLSGSGRVVVNLNGRRRRVVRVAGTPRLYTLVRLAKARDSLLELRLTPGIAGYAFTFG